MCMTRRLGRTDRFFSFGKDDQASLSDERMGNQRAGSIHGAGATAVLLSRIRPWRDSMRRTLLFVFAVTLLSAASVQAQVGMPGIEYSGTVAGGDGVQLYPYDQQDPWLHGYYQRYPAYGGFASFRPYNYRHVFSQTQIAAGWGSSHGMPYSQQFWNKYRGSYLDQNLHSTTAPQQLIPNMTLPVYPASSVRPIAYEQVSGPLTTAPTQGNFAPMPTAPADQRPVHVFPNRTR